MNKGRMKKVIYLLIALCLAINRITFVSASENVNNKYLKLWYPSKLNDNNFEFVYIEMPKDVNNLPEYAIRALINGKGLNENIWNEIPSGINLNSVIIKDNVAELNFDNTLLDKITDNHSMYFIINSIKKTLNEFDFIDSFVIKVNGEKIEQINEYIIDNNLSITSSKNVFLNVMLGDPEIPNPVIYLDAGHGGTAPGAVGADGTKESNINLQIALKVRDYLQAKGATVIMSRTSDITKDMDTRVAEANNSNIDFIVTIHCNSSTNTSARGYQVFYPSTHDVSISTALATKINSRLAFTSIPKFGSPTTHDGIGLLLYTKSPAVLVETAFMSNSQDLALLKSPTEQSNIANNIYIGIRQWWWGN
ncbi:MAG: N-acetylmuramoyl-L-alanine amidase [Sedimentibacter saalensis]|uniref:N-acetylmuramoyl-L-alanine amidase n=1 Tax=Sedimentibacter saalensis TaxID=130788 RepID=UPI002B213E01|nr:N-acetylmuramoyl-L-alanine amidase [Sedimentibacter saalensis]MEA5096480.1 N-acetylmuramoyl-L-alanine amidase [Sedimentibacter saalensis]